MTEDDFLEAIRKDLDNDTPRLVYADWLEEQGNLDRARFIRLECRFHELYYQEAGRDEQEYQEVCSELDELQLRERQDEWLETIGETEYNRATFTRGFIESLSLEIDQPTEQMRRWGRSPYVSKLRSFEPRGELGDHGLRELLDSATLSDLSELRLHAARSYTAASIEKLTESACFPKLKNACFNWTEIGDMGVLALTRAGTSQIEELLMRRCGISPQGAMALAKATNLSALKRLDLAANFIGAEGAAEILASRQFKLEKLSLCEQPLGEGLEAIVDSHHPLEQLDLYESGVSDAGVAAIVNSPCRKTLRNLSITDTELTDAALESLSGSKAFTQLKHLDLRDTSEAVSSDSQVAFANSKAFPKLEELYLNNLSEAALWAFVNTKTFPNLREINVAPAELSDELRQALEKRFERVEFE